MAFSVKDLMLLILVTEIGLAALTNADRPFVAELVNLGTLAIIILMGYGVWNSEGNQRAYRLGFVAWSGVYLLAARLIKAELPLVTTTLLHSGWQVLQPSRITSLDGTGDPFLDAQINWINRSYEVGQCLFAMLFGLIGGWMTVFFFLKRQRMLSNRN